MREHPECDSVRRLRMLTGSRGEQLLKWSDRNYLNFMQTTTSTATMSSGAIFLCEAPCCLHRRTVKTRRNNYLGPVLYYQAPGLCRCLLAPYRRLSGRATFLGRTVRPPALRSSAPALSRDGLQTHSGATYTTCV